MFARRNGHCAVFVRHYNRAQGFFGRRRFLGHVFVGYGPHYDPAGRPLSTLERARRSGRQEWRLYVRSCDLVEAEHDGGRVAWWQRQHAPAPGGVGLL
jgi:hypothetical protein